MGYDIPSAASGAAGLEGFAVGAGATVAAVNESDGGLVLVVETGEGFRAVPVSAVARVEMLPRRVVLTEEGERLLAASPPVQAKVVRIETTRLVRFVPRELAAVTVEGEAPPQERVSPLWVTGTVLSFVAGVALFTGVPLEIEHVGGSLAWLWVAIPGVFFALGLALLWRALATGHGRRLSRFERAGDAVAFVLGISPPERRRG
ncbi:MAG: hypothetical protein JOZ56_04415 [Actinobacteria bacterium]|nr:hypothetical protein [Actinomycetota bacterium]